MASPARQVQGFALRKLFVPFATIAILGILAVPLVKSALLKLQIAQSRQNAGSIHLVTSDMAVDGENHKDSCLGWPGDLKVKGRIATLGDFVNLMVRNGYLKPGDLGIFSGPGYKPYRGTLTSGSNGVLVPAFTDENCAYKIYLVKDSDSSNTVFLMSKNGVFGDKGFVVVDKGGSARFFTKAQNLQLPGGGTVESAENCLNPGPSAPK